MKIVNYIRKKKGRISTLLLLFFMLNCSSTFAIDILNANACDIKLAISDRLRTYTTGGVSYGDERGAVYTLTSMSILAMWNEFANHNTDVSRSQYAFKPNELKPYYEYLLTATNNFNNTYSRANDKIKLTTGISIAHGDLEAVSASERYKTFSKRAMDSLLKTSANYCRKLLDNLANEYNHARDKTQFKNDNGDLIKAIYQLNARLSQEKQNILGLCKVDDFVANNNYVYQRNLSSLDAVINDGKYSELMKYAKDLVDKDINNNGRVAPMSGNNNFDKLTEPGKDENGNTRALINSQYVMMMACSSIYVPFQSTVGGDSFIQCLSALTDGDSEAIDVYNELKSKKKPLYRRDLDGDGNPKGNGVLITIQDFIDEINGLKTGCLVPLKGSFQKSKASETFSMTTRSGVQVYNNDGSPLESNINGTTYAEQSNTSQDSQKQKEENNKQKDNSSEKKEGEKKEEEKKEENKTDNKATSDKSKTDSKGELEHDVADVETDENYMANPVFTYGTANILSKNSPKTAQTNLMMMYNILRESSSLKGLKSLNKQHLYINPFGDIVTQDDKVIVPAAANATYYTQNNKAVYYPATAAFMNPYPKVPTGKKDFQAESNSVEKYIQMITLSRDGLSGAKSDGYRVTDMKELGQGSLGPCEFESNMAYAAIIGKNKTSLKTTQIELKPMPLEVNIFNNGQDKLKLMLGIHYNYESKFFTTDFSKIGGAGSDTRQAGKVTIVPNTTIVVDTGTYQNVFPVKTDNSSDNVEKCKQIAALCYSSMTHSSGGDKKLLSERWRRGYITDMFIQAYNGTSNIAVFTKNRQKEYDDKDNESKFNTTIKGMVESLLDSVGNTGGILGLQDAYEDRIFGTILYNSNDFMLFILIGVALFFVVMYARKRVSIISGGVSIALALIATYLMLQFVPVYIPKAINFLINNSSDMVGYKALFMSQEQYRDPFKDKHGYDDQGNYYLGKSTITLYKLRKGDDLSIFYQQSLDPEDINTGKAYTLDDSSGLFIQGDRIKINLDRMFRGLEISGSYDKAQVGAPYTIVSRKVIGNCVDYYTPYYMVVDGFIDKLNKASIMFALPPSILQYGGGLSKDSFMVDAYTKSDLFLNGDNLSLMNNQYDTNMYNQMLSMFGDNNIDFLGLNYGLISKMQKDPSYLKSCQKTLWYQTMVQEGYYDRQTGQVKDIEKMSKLIEKVNRSVKIFMIDNQPQMKFISDENLIKIISLYAVTEMNREISSATDCLYPRSLNFEELKMQDVFLPLFTKDMDRYIAKEQKLIAYVNSEYGTFGLIGMVPVITLAFLISQAMKYATPILYALLLLFILARLTFKKTMVMKDVLKGYCKTFGILTGNYVLFCIITANIYRVKNVLFMEVVLMVVYSIIGSIMLTILIALLSGMSDFGNSNVNAAISKVGKRLHMDNMMNHVSQIAQRIKRSPDINPRDGRTVKDRWNKFSYDTSVDDEYGDEIQDRIMHKRHDDFNYNGEYKSFDKSRLRKRKVRRDYEIIEEDDEPQDNLKDYE